MPNLKDFIKKLDSEVSSIEEQNSALDAIEKTVLEVKQRQELPIEQNDELTQLTLLHIQQKKLQQESMVQTVDLIVNALKTVESKLQTRLNEVQQQIPLKGNDGEKGRDGRDGRDGKDGYAGKDGKDGVDGKDGKDGENGISVTDAQIDFDGSLLITLSDGREIDAGTVIPLAVAKQIHSVSTNGGGTSQSVLDAIAALQTQINTLIPSQTGNSGKYLTTDGSILSWGAITGSGVTSVTGTSPVVSSGGTTPAISISQATTTTDGYLTSTDWNTFNGKQPAGSYLTSGGALGTPSSGTVTNLTGTASININGTVGATTPAAGTFTNIASATAPTNTVPALALTGTPNNAAGAKTGVLAVGPNFTATDKNIIASFVQDINDYTQIVVQNPNAGASASADFIVNNNNTTGAGTYGDFGINSSAFSGTGSFSSPNAVYLYSQGGDLVIGTQSANIVKFPIGSSTAADAIQITSTGLNSAPIGATTASTGKFTTLECTSVTDTGSLARNAGRTANTTITNTATFTTGGITLPSQTAAVGSVWRIRAFGQFTAASSATARTAQVACFWGTTQLVAITPSVLISTAQTTQWQVEFNLTASSTTAIWTAGSLMSRTASATALAIDNAVPASTVVTSGAQTLDLRFRVSTAVAAESWIIQGCTMERLE